MSGLTLTGKIGSLTVRTFWNTNCRSQTDILTCAALQVGDKHRVTTPVNWNRGDDVIVHPSVSNDEAKTLFPDFTIHKVCFNVRWRIITLLTDGSLTAVLENYASQIGLSQSPVCIIIRKIENKTSDRCRLLFPNI